MDVIIVRDISHAIPDESVIMTGRGDSGLLVMKVPDVSLTNVRCVQPLRLVELTIRTGGVPLD